MRRGDVGYEQCIVRAQQKLADVIISLCLRSASQKFLTLLRGNQVAIIWKDSCEQEDVAGTLELPKGAEQHSTSYLFSSCTP